MLSLTQVTINSVPVTYQGADETGKFVFLAGKQQVPTAAGGDILGWQVGTQRTSPKGIPLISLKNGRLVRWLAHGISHSLPVSTLTFTQRGTNKSVSHHGTKGIVEWDGIRFRLDGVVGDKIKIANPETGQEAWVAASSGEIKSQLFRWIDRVRPK